VIIRPAVPEDAPRIAVVHVRSWQSAYRGMLPQEFLDALDPALREPRWRVSLEQETPPGGATLVVDNVGELLGFVHVCPTRDEDEVSSSVGEVTSIYLMPHVWGQGLGHRLMTAALSST
jgi:GNAT superfamily N-acetyltransferase